jgi:hypothetical protein
MAATERELREEIGWHGGEIYETGVSYANPSSQNNLVYSYLAVGGDIGPLTTKEAGADFSVEKVEFDEFVRMILAPGGEIMQSMHLTSIFFGLNFIRAYRREDETVRKLQTLLMGKA